MRRHPRDGEACARHLPIGIIVAPAPLRVGHDRLAPDFMKGDILRAVPRGRGNDDTAFDPVGEEGRPGQRLHAPHRPTDHRRQPRHAQMVEQQGLRPHHVGDGQHRKAHRKRIARRRIDARWAARPHAAADHIGADDEMARRVDRLALAHHPPPPAGLARARMLRCDILVAGQRMADQDGVGPVGIELPIGFIGDIDRPQRRPARQFERPGQADLAAQAETAVFSRDDAGHDAAALGPPPVPVNRQRVVAAGQGGFGSVRGPSPRHQTSGRVTGRKFTPLQAAIFRGFSPQSPPWRTIQAPPTRHRRAAKVTATRHRCDGGATGGSLWRAVGGGERRAGWSINKDRSEEILFWKGNRIGRAHRIR